MDLIKLSLGVVMINKKTMLGFATGISILGIALSANAAVDGPYIGAQLGWGNIHQNGISSGDVNDILASSFGPTGYTVTSFSNGGSDTGWAGRLFAGYQFDCVWSGELGWTKFRNMN